MRGEVERTMVQTTEEKFGRWLERFLEEMVPLERAFALAHWKASTRGRPEDEARLAAAEGAYRGLFANRGHFSFLKALAADGGVADPVLARQLDLLVREFEGNQMEEVVLKRMVALRVELDSIFNNFRATLEGQKVSDNRLREVLRDSSDGTEVRTAWEASKQIGPEAAPKILELVEVRNSVARALGHADFQDMSLRLDEIDPEWLFRLLEELEEVTAAPYKALKERIDAALSARFGIDAEELGPWHYGDPFFQSAPRTGSVDLDAFYRKADLPAMTVRFYDGLGLDIRSILDESDLLEREGKCQHAFCADMDRRGDVRVLANLKPTEHWMGTMLHEFGHAVYDQCFDPALPHILRGPAHISSTEAIAMLFGRISKDRRFLAEIAGADPAAAAGASGAAQEELRADELIFLRWAMVVVHFERELYRNPGGDLSTVWWDLVERFQGLRRPEGRTGPDWASKIHIATSPVYYQNYILGELTASQIQQHILSKVLHAGADGGLGSLIGRREVGDFLREKVFQPGRRGHWQEMLRHATGSPLEASHWVEEVSGAAVKVG